MLLLLRSAAPPPLACPPGVVVVFEELDAAPSGVKDSSDATGDVLSGLACCGTVEWGGRGEVEDHKLAI